MQALGPQIAQEVRKKMAKEGVKGTKEELSAVYSKRLSEAVSTWWLYASGGVMLLTPALGSSRTEEAAIRARCIANVDYGRTCADAVAPIRVFFDVVLAVNPNTFRARVRDVPNIDFFGEPRPDCNHSYPHWHDHLRKRRVCEVVHL